MTLHVRRLIAVLAAAALGGAAFTAASSASSPAHADAAEPVAPAITAGGNGNIVWTVLTRNSGGDINGGHLYSTEGYPYSLADSGIAPRYPEWSPDGGQIAYTAYAAASGASTGIWTVGSPFHSHTTPVQLTTSANDANPTWSPDGTQIAFYRGEGGPGAWGLYLIDAAGGTPHRILASEWIQELSWSPDGTKIAYATYCCGTGSALHVYVLDLDGGPTLDLGLGLSPSWKPDGTKILFEYAFTTSDHDIYMMNPDGTSRTGLQTGTVSDTEPAWSPDGTQIAFHRSGGIYTWPLSGGNPVQVQTNGVEVESTTWGSTQSVCQGRPTTISGTAGPDTIRGSDGVDVINGLGGSDTIIGLDGQDVICGGPGNDTVSYAGQTAPAKAAIGETDPRSDMSDLIADDVENLVGGAGPDYLVGDDRQNVLSGGRGDDTLYGGGDADTVSGEGGDDVVVGDDGTDELSGDNGDDVVRGGADDDHLYGGIGDDVLRGGEGDDGLYGGDDADLMVGGPGTMDLADYTGRVQPVTVTIGGPAGEDGGKVDGGADDRDTVTGSVENITGGNGADTLIGNDLNNQIRGNAGADTMRGGEGKDLIRAVDGVADLVIDCGADTDSPAVKDAIDPAPISCP